MNIYYKAEGEPHYYKIRQKSLYHNEVTHLETPPAGSGIVFNADGEMEIVANISDKSTSLADCEPYLPVHPRNVSLHSCINDNKDYCLEFTAKLKFAADFEKADKIMGSAAMPLYHDYVMWAYALRLTRDQDDSYSMVMKSFGPHFGGIGKKGLSDLSLPHMEAPSLVEAALILFHPDKEQQATELQLLRSTGGGYHVDKVFTEEELRHYQDDAGHLNFSLRLIVPRSFFSLDRLINLSPTTVSATTQYTVEQIMQGKKPRSSDLRIRACHVGSECCNKDSPMPIYHVHKSAFATYKLIRELETKPREIATFSAVRLCDHMLRLVIPVAYGLDAPLPKTGQRIDMNKTDKFVFEECFLDIIKPHWERAICRQAMAMDKHNPSSSMSDLFHLLDIIWSMNDCFPVAKRVALGVLVDMAHLNARSSLQEWVTESVLPHLEESRCGSGHVSGILTSFHKFMNMVPKVEKTIIPLWVDYWPS